MASSLAKSDNEDLSLLTPLTKGDVSYSRKPSIEVPEGEVLLCSTRPVGDIELDL
jgi:hypothetical protein